jgi:adenylate cyclase
MARLIALATDEHRPIELGELTSLGRHPNNTIRIPDEGVSKLHALIQRLPDGSFLLRDTHSLNGTFVRGKRVNEVRLEDGDLVRLGSARFLFVQGRGSPSIARAGAPGAGAAQARPPEGLEPALGAGASLPPGGDARWSGPADFPPAGELESFEDLRRRYERLRADHDLGRELGAELELDAVLRKTLDHALERSGAERGAILLADLEGGLVPRCRRAAGGREADGMAIPPSILEEARWRMAGPLFPGLEPGTGDDREILLRAPSPECLVAPLLLEGGLLGLLYLEATGGSWARPPGELQDLLGIAERGAIAIRAASMAREREREAQARAQLSRLLPPRVVEQVLRGEVALDPRGTLREITVLYSDLQGFTAATGREPPQEVVRSLNESLELLVEALFRHGGTLDRFVGDQIIGLFGAPGELEDAPLRAVECGLEMIRVQGEVNRGRVGRGRAPLELGVGVATGPAIVGAIGSTWALQYTALGGPIKEASALAAGAGAAELLVSEETLCRVQGQITAEEVGGVRLDPGKTRVRAYRVTTARSRVPWWEATPKAPSGVGQG